LRSFSFRHVDIRPFYPADLSLTHCCRDCEANNSSERFKLLRIGLRVLDKRIQFILSGTTVALIGFPDEIEMFKHRSGQLNALDGNIDAMNRCSVE